MKVREIITYKTISMISSNANRKRSGIKSLRYFADFGVAFFDVWSSQIQQRDECGHRHVDDYPVKDRDDNIFLAQRVADEG